MSSIKYEIHLRDGSKMTCIDPSGEPPDVAIKGFCRDFAHRGVVKVEYDGKEIDVADDSSSGRAIVSAKL